MGFKICLDYSMKICTKMLLKYQEQKYKTEVYTQLMKKSFKFLNNDES